MNQLTIQHRRKVSVSNQTKKALQQQRLQPQLNESNEAVVLLSANSNISPASSIYPKYGNTTKQSSSVWKHFQGWCLGPDKMDPNIPAKCLLCQETIIYAGSTTTLNNHLRTKHKV